MELFVGTIIEFDEIMKSRSVCFFILFLLDCLLFEGYAQRVTSLLYGDMDNWIVRKIHESAIIGGQTKYVYELGPSDTIIGNIPYTNRGGSPWGTSNVMAKVAGVVKTNTSVFPEKRGNGWCARLETRYVGVKVLGVVNIEVIAAGSVYLGTIYEPIRGTRNPQSMLQSGIPFTNRPKALRFDYKIKLAPEKNRIRSTGFSRKTSVAGRDSIAVVVLLQKRWEDKDGNVYSKRVGTMIQRFGSESKDWINGATFPIQYGNITSQPYFKSYMRLQEEERYTRNSKGESVPIREVGWSDASETPTHAISQFSSSHGGAYVGSPGNTLWIDNVQLVY